MYTEIKHPFAHLSKDHNSVVFFEHDFGGNEPIASWDDIADNYPRWTLAVHTREEALTRIREMVENEEWELYESSEEELEDLVS